MIDLHSDDTELTGATCCECKCCGLPRQGCNVRCPEFVKMMIARRRGKNLSVLRDLASSEPIDKEAHPKFCGDCVDHALLDLRRQAVKRKRENTERERQRAVMQRGLH